MIATLQSLRFVFVMLIFLSHFEYKEIAPLDAGGDCGVAFFFLLSGYVLSIRYGKCPAGLMLATCFSIILVISWVVQIIISRLMRLY